MARDSGKPRVGFSHAETQRRREELFCHKEREETQRTEKILDRINGIYRIKENPVNLVNPVKKTFADVANLA